jgi:hypothetical protein
MMSSSTMEQDMTSEALNNSRQKAGGAFINNGRGSLLLGERMPQ